MRKIIVGIVAALVMSVGATGCRDDNDKYYITYEGEVVQVIEVEGGTFQITIQCSHEGFPDCFCNGLKNGDKCKRDRTGDHNADGHPDRGQ